MFGLFVHFDWFTLFVSGLSANRRSLFVLESFHALECDMDWTGYLMPVIDCCRPIGCLRPRWCIYPGCHQDYQQKHNPPYLYQNGKNPNLSKGLVKHRQSI